jgi:hypothetical protein
MGVKDLNVLIKSYPPSTINRFSTVVIDGSNMFIIVLNRALKNMRENFPLKVWNTVDLNIFEQYNYITNFATKEINNIILTTKSLYDCSEIIIVMDPSNTVSYKFYDSMIFDQNYKQFFFGEFHQIDIQIKEKEQSRRTDMFEKKTQNDRHEQDIINACSYVPELKETDLSFIIEAYKQSSYFMASCNLLKLIKVVLSRVFLLGIPFVKIVMAIDEADLVIKNIVENALEKKSEKNNSNSLASDHGSNISINTISNSLASDHGSDISINSISNPLALDHGPDTAHNTISNNNSKQTVLVLSKDTDYFVLFANSPQVYCSAFDSVIFSPYFVWTSFLGVAFSYDLVVRLAPLLGNDYSGEGLILIRSSLQSILYLMNINNSFSKLKSENRTKVKKIFSSMQVKENELTPLSKIDEVVYNYSKSYFKTYMSSVMIYTNWQYFNKCCSYTLKSFNFKDLFRGIELHSWQASLLPDWFSFKDSISLIGDINEGDSLQNSQTSYTSSQLEKEVEENYVDYDGYEYID